jgi:ATP-dependent RNA helicase DDX24/MAK5
MDYNNYPTSGFGAVVDGVDLDAGADVSNWLEFDLHPKLLRALQDMGFTDPTPIQREVLNPAIKGRCDVIGAAETGSGKTLAFGLPILHRLLTQMDAEAEDSDSESGSDSDAKEGGDEEGDGTNADDGERQKGGSDSESDPFANIVDETGRSGAGAGFRLPKRRKALRALIVAPTRELAMQVCDMLKAVAKYAPEVGITPVVGGMSLQKQERLLRRRPEIVVATPGRLWELMHQQGHEHFLDLGRLNFLVLDEADRMVERGHFAELHNIIDILPMPPRVKRPPGAAKATPETLKVFKKRGPASAPANAGKRGGKGMKGGNAPVVDGDIVAGVCLEGRERRRRRRARRRRDFPAAVSDAGPADLRVLGDAHRAGQRPPQAQARAPRRRRQAGRRQEGEGRQSDADPERADGGCALLRQGQTRGPD